MTLNIRSKWEPPFSLTILLVSVQLPHPAIHHAQRRNRQEAHSSRHDFFVFKKLPFLSSPFCLLKEVSSFLTAPMSIFSQDFIGPGFSFTDFDNLEWEENDNLQHGFQEIDI
jgi:hypothetical protein